MNLISNQIVSTLSRDILFFVFSVVLKEKKKKRKNRRKPNKKKRKRKRKIKRKRKRKIKRKSCLLFLSFPKKNPKRKK